MSPAPWKTLFLSHLSKLETGEFIFTSLQPRDDVKSGTPFIPRARCCVYRSMWAELPDNKHNNAPRNDHVYDSDMLTFTSDARMGKIQEIFESSGNSRDISQTPTTSGGGGPVEALFWIRDAMTQWRFSGQAFIVGPDIGANGPEDTGPRKVRSALRERMRVIDDEGGEESWSWEKEATAHFGNLSPAMRGSFRRPAPGSPVSIPLSDDRLSLGQKITQLDDELARQNFRVVVIRPDEVEQLDLSEREKPRRWRFTYVGSVTGQDGPMRGNTVEEWKKEELWP